eukprot:30993-Pelagococcus_subviridis.AAC.7
MVAFNIRRVNPQLSRLQHTLVFLSFSTPRAAVYSSASAFVRSFVRLLQARSLVVTLLRSAVRARPHQHVQVTKVFRGLGASTLVPRAAFRARPLQHVQVTAFRGVGASPLVPRAAFRARPLQHLQVAFTRGTVASPLIPRSWGFTRARPLQHLQLAAIRGEGASRRVPRSFVLS